MNMVVRKKRDQTHISSLKMKVFNKIIEMGRATLKVVKKNTNQILIFICENDSYRTECSVQLTFEVTNH